MGRTHRTAEFSRSGAEYSYTPLGETETLHARQSEESDAWESRIRYDERGREIERFATGGVRITSEYDFAGRLEARCTYAWTESRGHRFYAWRRNDRLFSLRSRLRKSPVMYDYDSFGILVCASLDMSECLFKTPDIIGNVHRDRDARGRVYDRSGRLLKDEKNYCRYDGEGNLILKSTRNVLEPPVMPQPKDWFDKLFTRTTPNDKDLQAHYSWQQGDTAYEWYGNGMLKSVRTPEGATIRFEYDALGRRTLKETHDLCHRYACDGNVLLHEWDYDRREKPRMEKDELGRIRYDRPEPYSNLITWVYDGGSYTPVAKLTEEDSYSIVQDYLGTPIQALDSKGEVVWDCILDIYGDVLELRGKRDFIPFRFQGMYYDTETELCYVRHRYYSCDTGTFISQDPIGLQGGMQLYAYVHDTNSWIDPLGLSSNPITFTSSSGQTHQVSGYTNLSHTSDAQLNALYHANNNDLNGKGFGLSGVDKQGNTIVLHHYKQNPNGDFIAMPAKHHDKPHTNPGQLPFGKQKVTGLTPDERVAFNKWKHEYWKSQAEAELKARGKKNRLSLILKIRI